MNTKRVKLLFTYHPDMGLFRHKKQLNTWSDKRNGIYCVYFGILYNIAKLTYQFHYGLYPEHIGYRDDNRRNILINNLYETTKAGNNYRYPSKKAIKQVEKNKWKATLIRNHGLGNTLGTYRTKNLAWEAVLEAHTLRVEREILQAPPLLR